ARARGPGPDRDRPRSRGHRRRALHLAADAADPRPAHPAQARRPLAARGGRAGAARRDDRAAARSGLRSVTLQTLMRSGRGTTRLVDVGRIDWPAVGERSYFLLMAGLGFDGEVMRMVDRKLKRRFGFPAYMLASVAAYFQHEPYQASIDVDGGRYKLSLTQL